MDIKAQSLYNELQAMAVQSQMPINNNIQPNVVNPSAQNFSDMLSSAINKVNSMQLEAKDKTIKFEMGDPNMSLADVMVAKEKSGIAFEATLQVRNKVMEAYKQIMQMPV